MEKKAHKELYKAIDKILWNDWDPIGINDEIAARDEYQSYIPEIFSLLIQNKSEKEIVDSLCKIENERMGLECNREHCILVAKKLMTEKDKTHHNMV